MAGTFGLKALSIFPEMNGTCMAMMTAIRQFLASGLVVLSEIFFDGTLIPVAMIIFSYAAFSTICYVLTWLQTKEPATLKTNASI